MSILPLSGFFQLGLSFYTIKVVVEDLVYTKQGGQDVPQTPSKRTIDAAIDPGSSRQLEKLFGGGVSDGDIGIYTAAQLFIRDEGDTKQSFVQYGGFSYAVTKEGDWTQQAGMRVYLGNRHVKQN